MVYSAVLCQLTENLTVMSFRGPGLYEFLTEAELQQYYNHFKNDLKVC